MATEIGIDDYEFEQRITNSETGGQKGRKLARFGLIPARALRALARHYGIGAIKYDDNNWRLGYDWSLSIDALERHLNAWKSGETVYIEKFEKDGEEYEVETNHLIAVAWQAFTLYTFEQEMLGNDDRRDVHVTAEESQRFPRWSEKLSDQESGLSLQAERLSSSPFSP